MSRSTKLQCAVCAFLLMAVVALNASAADLRNDLTYNFSNKTETEFYIGGTGSAYNISGDLTYTISRPSRSTIRISEQTSYCRAAILTRIR